MLDAQGLFSRVLQFSEDPEGCPPEITQELFSGIESLLVSGQMDTIFSAMGRLESAEHDEAGQTLFRLARFLSENRFTDQPASSSSVFWTAALVEIPERGRLPFFNHAQRELLATRLRDLLLKESWTDESVELRLPLSFGLLTDLPSGLDQHRSLLDRWAEHVDEARYPAFPDHPAQTLPVAETVRIVPAFLPVLFFSDQPRHGLSLLENFNFPFADEEDRPTADELLLFERLSDTWTQWLSDELAIPVRALLPVPFLTSVDLSALLFHRGILSSLLERVQAMVPESDWAKLSWTIESAHNFRNLQVHTVRLEFPEMAFRFPMLYALDDPAPFIVGWLGSAFPSLPDQPAKAARTELPVDDMLNRVFQPILERKPD